MWFKNLAVFGINPRFKLAVDALKTQMFQPATSSQMRSEGFSPVRSDELAYTRDGNTLLRYTVEQKSIPSSAIAQLVADKAAEMEKTQGFAPGKKMLKELKERAIDELTPRALASRRSVLIWIDEVNCLLVIDSSSKPMIDSINRALIRLFENLGLCDVSWPRAAVITEWLVDEPQRFTLDAEAVLRYPGASGKVVSYKSTNLGDDDVQRHVQKHGATVENLAMTFDDKVSFVMTDNSQVLRVRPLEVLKESDAATRNDDERFDNDFALMTGELALLIHALIREA